MVVWRGTSQLDGVTPIVVLATYDTSAASSSNRKTGDMIQTWILRDDVEPHSALQTGQDTSICGDCPHRSVASGGSGACYVTVWQGPLSLYRAYKRGNYVEYDPEVFRGRKVRFGAYGDPAAAPYEVWESIHSVAAHVTGYTHQWRTADPRFARFCMASADSVTDGIAARRQGYRSFIVRAPGTPKPKGAVMCPASAEAGKKTTCSTCLQCGGTASGRLADITIEAHGVSRNKFANREG